jgi:hypothetical protein
VLRRAGRRAQMALALVPVALVVVGWLFALRA